MLRRGPKRGTGVIALVIVFAFLALPLWVACEYPGVRHPLAAEVAKEGPPLPQATPVGSPQPTATPQATTAATPQTAAAVEIALKDFRLEPDNVPAKAGKVTFVLKNEGRYTHDFRIEGQGVDTNAGKLGASRSIEWEVALEPGVYRISCRVSNHDQRGMVGTLVVAP